eukprot:2773470-Heterocapsa_arctica.AAC.1
MQGSSSVLNGARTPPLPGEDDEVDLEAHIALRFAWKCLPAHHVVSSGSSSLLLDVVPLLPVLGGSSS